MSSISRRSQNEFRPSIMAESSIPSTKTRQAAAIEGRSKRLRVTGKLCVAFEAMIWEGLTRKDAAEKAGLADPSLRFAMRKPHVMAHFNAELANLRTSLRARNLHRLDGIADASKNDMARVASIKVLEQLADVAEQNHRPDGQSPGVSIIIVQVPDPKVINSAPISAEFERSIPAPGQ
jgi:hypothetical protein